MNAVYSMKCPRCGEPLDLPEGVSNGQGLLCPCCGEKFTAQNITNDEVRKVAAVKRTRLSCGRRLGDWFRERKHEVVVAIALVLTGYLCVLMTIMVCKMQNVETSVRVLGKNVLMLSSDVGSLESDMSMMKSNVDLIESNLSYIKICGVEISR